MILLVLTDGRTDYLAATIDSAREHLAGDVTYKVIHDDTGNETHRDRLREMFSDFEVIGRPTRQGFGGAIRSAWAHLSQRPERFVFHLEDDFTFSEPFVAADVCRVLDRNPHLMQMALRRQPWNDDERAAGGIVEQHPDEFLECSDGVSHWLEHRRFFTTNPCVYRSSLMSRGWPDGANSEGVFGVALRADPDVRFGYWGRRSDPPKVHHIGDERVGTGY